MGNFWTAQKTIEVEVKVDDLIDEADKYYYCDDDKKDRKKALHIYQIVVDMYLLQNKPANAERYKLILAEIFAEEGNFGRAAEIYFDLGDERLATPLSSRQSNELAKFAVPDLYLKGLMCMMASGDYVMAHKKFIECKNKIGETCFVKPLGLFVELYLKAILSKHKDDAYALLEMFEEQHPPKSSIKTCIYRLRKKYISEYNISDNNGKLII
jgi:hypothetical protein